MLLPQIIKKAKTHLRIFAFGSAGTVSRVLSRVIICLGRTLPSGSSGLPEAQRAAAMLPLVLLRMGFTWTRAVAGTAVVSCTAFPPLQQHKLLRFISVALSLKLPSPDVIRHPAL